ncbi:MAG: kelch repeat-containing protein [Terriglobales bacterium]
MPVFHPVVKRVPGALLSLSTIFALSTALILTACGGSSAGGGSTPPPPPNGAKEWAWMSGSNTANAIGVYGTQGVASASNVPGARSGSVSWTDGGGNLWLFGGWGGDSTGTFGELNDLWEFSPTAKEWTWMSGSNTINATGVYGTLGTASASNVPGARDSAVSWTDSSGNFWLFGGEGYTTTGGFGGFLNDLWEFSPTTKEWTWMSGADTPNASGVYGTQGVASASNVPGARGSESGGAALSWTDKSGNLWLFGGSGYDSTGTNGGLNDLWEFNLTAKTWTWVSGSNTANAFGVYGTQGVASASNVPGARSYSVNWTDRSGNLWLFGGSGLGAVGSSGYDLDDLWEFNPTTKEWTWVNGSDTGGIAPVYGTEGVASTNNTPGGRDSAVSWTDSSGNFWLFGGFDYDGPSGANGTNEYLNDLWEYNTTSKEWTWVGGSNTGGASGVYGTLGVASTRNVPGARGSEGVAVTWTDSSGNLWLFGGVGYDSTGTWGELNDLWRYQP